MIFIVPTDMPTTRGRGRYPGMKIDRLIGILSILLQNEKTTAPELAERFEVSRRTINRDIEDLCKAGIPIRTAQGTGGGISIMDGYRMDRTILTSKDMQMILAGLRSLDSVSGSSYYGQLMEKIQAGSSEFITGRDSILIDLSSWYRESLAPKIETIQDAIGLRKTIRFKYYSPGGDTEREIEPYYLIFKWTSWYVYGYCLMRNDFRLFKLNRMDSITHIASFEENREVPLPDLSNEKVFPAKDRVKALFDPSMKWQLVEEYGVDSFTEQDDGSLLFEHEYADDEGLLSWMLSCRDKVTVLEPERIREKLYQITSEIAKRYEENGNEKQSIGRDRPSE
jgi:predicted DNA-binding transcriptional regulator YafY